MVPLRFRHYSGSNVAETSFKGHADARGQLAGCTRIASPLVGVSPAHMARQALILTRWLYTLPIAGLLRKAGLDPYRSRALLASSGGVASNVDDAWSTTYVPDRRLSQPEEAECSTVTPAELVSRSAVRARARRPAPRGAGYWRSVYEGYPGSRGCVPCVQLV